MIDVNNMGPEAVESYSPLNEDVGFWQVAYAVDPDLTHTWCSCGNSDRENLANWEEDRNLQSLIIQIYRNKNLVRPEDMPDVSWDYCFRTPLRLEYNDIRDIEVAVREHNFPFGEGADFESEQQQHDYNIGFIQRAYAALEKGQEVYFMANAYK